MLDDSALKTLFLEARTQNGWLDKPVSDQQLRQIYELMKWGPTSANCSPARIVFAKSPEAKEKLLACMDPGNIEKTRAAPVTAIIGMDMEFYEKLPKLFPHNTDARSWFAGNPAAIDSTTMRNSSLQGGYFILAARAVGLDCAPMSGFNPDRMNETFFAGTSIKVNFVCSLGYGDAAKLHARGPRLPFAEACTIV
jgi:3-hydroxypropanoate dehydrogenase